MQRHLLPAQRRKPLRKLRHTLQSGCGWGSGMRRRTAAVSNELLWNGPALRGGLRAHRRHQPLWWLRTSVPCHWRYSALPRRNLHRHLPGRPSFVRFGPQLLLRRIRRRQQLRWLRTSVPSHRRHPAMPRRYVQRHLPGWLQPVWLRTELHLLLTRRSGSLRQLHHPLPSGPDLRGRHLPRSMSQMHGRAIVLPSRPVHRRNVLPHVATLGGSSRERNRIR